MLEFFVGLQAILTFFVSAKLLDNATNIGFIAAVVFGGIPAVVIMGALYMVVPKIMLLLGTLFWATTGYGIGSSIGGEGATMAALTVLLGVIGFAANYQVASQGLQLQRENAQNAPKSEGWKAADKADVAESGFDLVQLSQANARLFNLNIIAPATYGRIASRLPPHGKVAPVDVATQDGHDQIFDNFFSLADHNFLSPDEEADGKRILNALPAPASARPKEPEQQVASRDASDPLARPTGDATVSRPAQPDVTVVRSKLLHLVACRALSMDGFVRAMLKINPDFDPRLARIENFPEQWPVPESVAIAKDLYRLGIVSLEDLQNALDVLTSQPT